MLDLRVHMRVRQGEMERFGTTHVAPTHRLDALSLHHAENGSEEQPLVEAELADERRRRAVLHRLQHALHVVRARRPFLLLHELDRASV